MEPSEDSHDPPVGDEIDAAPYEVKLEVFEGPLDLLLYLIRRDELDIYDIPLARVVAQYLASLSQLHRLDLEQASDFILMAATLMKIKSQLMLPRPEGAAAEECEEDPREELVRRLLEYQQFREIADWLDQQRESRRDIHLRRPVKGEGRDEDRSEDTRPEPVSLFRLLQVYKHVLDTVPMDLVHRIVEEVVSVDECIERVIAMLGRRSRLRFADLIEGGTRESLIATFVGLLELLKGQRVRAQQARPFGDIWIERNPRIETAPAAGEEGVEETP